MNILMYKKGTDAIKVFPSKVSEMIDKGWSTEKPVAKVKPKKEEVVKDDS